MCGRLNITDDPLTKMVSEALGIKFQTDTNHDLCPTQRVSTVACNGALHQLETTWGIKPQWSKKLLVNAQAETVATKPTFKKAFTEHRCVVPCSGWYEWSSFSGDGKKKYLFESDEDRPVYMAGIYYPILGQMPELVTLTTKPNEVCARYHHRMPLLIPEKAVEDYLRLPADMIAALLIASAPRISITETLF